MIKVDVGKQYNIFCVRVYPCPRPQGQVDYSIEMEDSRRGKHLSCPTESRRLHYSLPTQDGGAFGGEGRGSEFQRCSGASSFNGAFLQSSFLWLRQAGSDQSERQAVGARRHTRQGCVGWELLSFCDLVGGSLRKAGVCGPKEHF